MKELIISESWYYFLIAAFCCYIVGCFNFAVLISHFKHKDIRSEGSGNPGTMNMTRTFGLKIGVVNFICDILKGGIPSIVGFLIFKDYVFAGTDFLVSDFAKIFFGLFAIIGHCFPVTMKFKGGKGIASTVGVLWFSLATENLWFILGGLAVILVAFVYIYYFEWGSMGSLMVVAALTIMQTIMFVTRYYNELLNVWFVSTLSIILLINFITWFAHRKNLFRLLAGEEHRTNIKKKKKVKKIDENA